VLSAGNLRVRVPGSYDQVIAAASELPQFIGRAIAALAADPHRMQKTGQVLVATALALEYGFTDIDGKQPRPLSVAEA